MIEVLVEVISGPAPIRMSIRAESLLEALDAAKARYLGDEVRVVFPISPEEFFVRDTDLTGRYELDESEETAR